MCSGVSAIRALPTKFDGLTSQQFKIATLTSPTAISLRPFNRSTPSPARTPTQSVMMIRNRLGRRQSVAKGRRWSRTQGE